jgi:putative DNA-invertase from lambdoid prophage Rac
MAVYIYIRVSTLRQVDGGQSLEVQQRTALGYAMMHGLKVDRVFIERGVSGSVPLEDRPEGSQLISVLKPGDIVITPKLDRMFRSATDALAILKFMQENQVQLHMLDLGGDVTGNGISKLVFTILSAVAEAERDRTRERIKEVKAAQREQGKYLGGPVPYGFIRDPANPKQLKPDERQQRFIEVMHKAAADGHSLREIQVAVWNMSVHFPPVEKPSLVTISKIIKSNKGVTRGEIT